MSAAATPGSTRPVAGHGLVFFPSGFDAASSSRFVPTARVTCTGLARVWRFGKGVPSKPSMMLANDLLFMINDGGIAGAARREDRRGRVARARRRAPTRRRRSSAAGRIYAFNEDGKTTVLDAGREFKVLAENLLEDGFMASPAVDGKALFLRTRTHVYRIEE